MIDLFIQKMCGYNERIEIFKNAMFEKITNQRIINFKHSFKVKFIDSKNSKTIFCNKYLVIIQVQSPINMKLNLYF